MIRYRPGKRKKVLRPNTPANRLTADGYKHAKKVTLAKLKFMGGTDGRMTDEQITRMDSPEAAKTG